MQWTNSDYLYNKLFDLEGRSRRSSLIDDEIEEGIYER